jgi:deoxyribodipyrimidine photo-lyase
MSKRARSPSPVNTLKKTRVDHTSSFAPRKIATAEAAAAVQANPPFLRLLDEVRNVVRNPQLGKSIVYWMRMGDLRSELVLFAFVYLTDSMIVVDNRALAAASKQAARDKLPLVVLFVLSPQDYLAHDRSKRRIDFVLRNLSEIKVCLWRETTAIDLLTIVGLTRGVEHPSTHRITHY